MLGWRFWGPDVARSLVLGALVLVVAAVVGVMVVRDPEFAVLAAVGVLALGIIAVDPLLVVVLAVPGSLLMGRIGGALSIADVVLAIASAIAFIVLRGVGTQPLQPLIWAGIAYLASTLPTLILNQYEANFVEWAHSFVLVIGSMVAGYAIGRLGRARQAIGLYVLACVVLGVVTFFTGLVMFARGEGFGPVFLPDLHKNFIGGALAVAIVILYARPAWFRWTPKRSWAAIVAMSFGLLASGARQGMIAVIAGILIVSLRPLPDTGRRPKLVWYVSAPVLVAVLALVNDQLETGDQFNSAYQRLNWFERSIQIWETSPVFGVGLRWWYTDSFGDDRFQPPNVEFELLSTVGVVGMLGFFAMFIVAFWAMWRINPAYGTVGAAVIGTRFVQAQFDLYWIAGQASLLWIVAAVCIGVLERDRAMGRESFVVASPPVQRHRAVRHGARPPVRLTREPVR